MPADRSKAIGAWSGFGGLATAGGPVLGGWLIDVASWRWVFLVNLPMAAATVWITARHVPESRDEARAARGGRLDVGGAALAVVWLGALALALIGAPDRGWTSTATLGLLAVTVVAFAAFIVVERRAADPMLPLEVFAEPRFTSINAVTFVVYGALTGALFLLPIVLQVGGRLLAAGVRPGHAAGHGDHARRLGAVRCAGHPHRAQAAAHGRPGARRPRALHAAATPATAATPRRCCPGSSSTASGWR